MPTFIYKVKTRTGETVGEMAGNSKGEVERLLKKQKIRVVSVKKKKEPMFGNPMPSDRDIVVFTRQFATMIGAGLPLLQCLVILTESTDNKRFQGIIKEAKEAIEKGETLAEGLRKNPKVFDKLFTNMVEAGEIGGSLDTTLSRLAIYKEKAAALKGQVKSAMVYPASIVAIATLVITFLMIAVIPQFAAMFEGSGQSLPLPTAIVMKMSDFVVSYILYAIPLAFLGFLGFKKYYDTTGGKRRVDALLLRLPVFGPLIQKVAVAKFTRTLGTLLKSGVPIIQAVDITGKTAGNKVIEDKIFELIDEIKQGKSLSEPLAKAKVFPTMVVSMIAVGEAVGSLDAMCDKIADFYDEEVELAVAGLTSMLEPMLMLFLGIVVGGIVIAMYLPIFKLASVAG